LRGLFRRHHRADAPAAGRIKGTRTFLIQLPRPVHERSVRNPQAGEFHLAGAHMSIGDERRQRPALPGGVGLPVRKIAVGANEIRDPPLLLEHTESRAYSHCAVRKSLQQ